MGKPEPVILPEDALSSHTQPGSSYHTVPPPSLPSDNDDLPPTYGELAEVETSAGPDAPLLPDYDHHHSQPDPFSPPDGLDHLQPFRRTNACADYLDPRLDSDPAYLESHIRGWAALPPRPFVRVRGTHSERRRSADGKHERREIVDFDVRVELTPYLYADAAARRAWDELHTVGDGDKVRRGTVCRRRAPGYHRRSGGQGDAAGHVELGAPDKPGLAQWCHMYCASHSGLKVFELRRRVVGFDEARVRAHIEEMVRRTRYRGRVLVSFPVEDETVRVWNDCRTNRWRLTSWVYTFFCLTMLWLLSWPYLFFRTRRFETVRSEWYFSRADGRGGKAYVSLSEDQWYNLWGRALSRAVLSRKQWTLDQNDLLEAEGAGPAFNSGVPAIDGGVDFVMAGLNAMNEVNRHLGWGEDRE